MITQLRGLLLTKQPPYLTIEAGYISYELQASMQTFYQLTAVGSEVRLYTHLLIRPEEHSLYGFAQRAECNLFRELIKVNGIGPKVALAILSSMESNKLIQAFNARDTSTLQRIPGIGKKTAERLLLEVTDRLKHLYQTISERPTHDNLSSYDTTVQEEAISALIALGYKRPAASQAIHQIAKPGLSVEQLIRLGLQNIR